MDMTDPLETAKLKLVTIIAPHGLGDHIGRELRALGVGGGTQTKADGWGDHGPRQFGLVDGANIRLDTLVSADLARKILACIVAKYSGDAVVAFMQDAEAVPQSRFT
jgi:hypothetical protein